MKFLVTDPCYVVPKDSWDDFLDNHSDFGLIDLNETPYIIPNFGKIIVSGHSEGGDGEWKVGNGKSICADAGLTCIVELDKGVVPTKYHGTAVTNTLGVAEHWFNRVTGFENFQ